MFQQNYKITAGVFTASECVDAKSAARMDDQLACQKRNMKAARDRIRFGVESDCLKRRKLAQVSVKTSVNSEALTTQKYLELLILALLDICDITAQR